MIQEGYKHICKIKNSSVLVYKKWEGSRTKKMQDCDLLKNFEGKKNFDNNGNEIEKEKVSPYCGQMTKCNTKRLIDTTELFLSACKKRWVYNKYIKKSVRHHFAFITLTVPFNEYRINGSEGYNLLLEPFLFWLVKTKKVNTYIWKAELQQPLDINGKKKKSNGQIHWHLMFPNWIDKEEIRKKWNYILKINGFLDNYFENKGHYDAPSTSIEKPYKSKDVADYILKEVLKNVDSSSTLKKLDLNIENQEKNGTKKGCLELLRIEKELFIKMKDNEKVNIGGKVWGCSNNLKRKKELIKSEEKQYEDINTKIKDYKVELSELIKKIKEFEEKKRLFEQSIEDNSIKLSEYTTNEDDFLKYQFNKQRFINVKSQCKWLKEEQKKYFIIQKNYFEVDMTDRFFKAINYTYKVFEERGDWVSMPV